MRIVDVKEHKEFQSKKYIQSKLNLKIKEKIMKKKLFIISLIAIFFVCLFSFGSLNVNAAEKTPEEMVSEELENIYLPDKAIIDFPVPTISVYNSTITWESKNEELLEVLDNGWIKVTRPSADTEVILTVTIENSGYTDSKEFKITVLKGTTLTNTYTVNYVLNDGTQNANNPTTYKVGEDVALYQPTKGRVEFLGWYLNENFEGEALEALPKGLSGDVTLYAKWDKAEVEKIVVETQPTKVVYNALESFDPTGIKVVAYYNDDLTVEQLDLNELSFDKDVLHGNDTKVVVSYKEFEAEVKVTVNKLKYDLSNVVFEDTTLTYNGQAQTIALPTNLPAGLTATVEGSATNVTTTPILVKLSFEVANPEDYETPEALFAYLTINKAKAVVRIDNISLNVSDVFDDSMVTYKVSGLFANDTLEGNFKPVHGEISTATPAVYEIGGEGLTSTNYEIEYVKGQLIVSAGEYKIHAIESTLNKVYNGELQMFEVVLKDGDRELTPEEMANITINYLYEGKEFKGATDAGTYKVTVTYQYESGNSGSATFDFVIDKADYDLSGISFESDSLVYNGQMQGLLIKGQLPEGVVASYTEGLINVGSKEIVVTFTGDTVNHNEIELELKATLTITAKDLAQNMFEAIPDQSETGEAVEPAISGKFGDAKLELGTDFTVTYENNIAQGTAKAVVTGIGNFQGEVELTFEIGESDLVKARKAREALEAKYTTNELPTEFVTTIDSAKVQWFSTSTALGINNANGAITMIQVEEEQVVLVYALVIVNNAAEYASFEFVVPALEQGQEPEQPEQSYVKLEDASKITDGTEIVLVSHDESNTLGANGGKFFAVNAFDKNNMDNVIVITLVKVQGGYKLKLGEGQYIYYKGSSNEAYVGAEQDNGSDIWTIEAVDGLFKINNTANTERYLQYNSNTGQERFSCYKGTMKDLVLYANPDTLGEGSQTPDEPEQPTHEHTVCPECGGCTAEDCDGTSEKCPGHPVEPEHEHVECPICGGCTAEDCDGAEEDKCPGHTQEPEQPSENGLLVTFEFGENGSAAHVDGNDLGTSKSYTEGTYTLELTNMSKVYGPAYDATGKSAIKLGTSKLNGSFSFTVAENVTKVVIKVAGYKATAGKVSVNGTEYTIETLSNNGAYTEITIDTTTNKSITLATVGTVYRAMVDSIAYYGGGSTTPEEPDQPEQPTHEHTACPECGKCTAEDCDGAEEDKCSCNNQEPEQPTYPESGEVTIEQAIAIGSAKEHNTYTEGQYVITGTVKEVKNTQYGNLVITDGTNDILVYGTYNASNQRYDAMATRPVVGDTVVYTGVLGQYNGTAQMKNGVVEFEVKHQHSFTNGKCDCGYEDPNYVEPEQPETPDVPSEDGLLVTFEFGANGTAAHKDGNAVSANKEYAEGNYTLTLTTAEKVYDGAFDAQGNSCLKFGTSSVVGKITFTVPEEVTKVVIKVAQYKANTTKIEVNGTAYTITTASNNGEYTDIVVDTTTTKTVTFATVSGGVRAMVNSIAYYKEN